MYAVLHDGLLPMLAETSTGIGVACWDDPFNRVEFITMKRRFFLLDE
jgi:hypothetical protein